MGTYKLKWMLRKVVEAIGNLSECMVGKVEPIDERKHII